MTPEKKFYMEKFDADHASLGVVAISDESEALPQALKSDCFAFRTFTADTLVLGGKEHRAEPNRHSISQINYILPDNSALHNREEVKSKLMAIIESRLGHSFNPMALSDVTTVDIGTIQMQNQLGYLQFQQFQQFHSKDTRYIQHPSRLDHYVEIQSGAKVHNKTGAQVWPVLQNSSKPAAYRVNPA